jgi:hypothetical protein
MGIGKFLEQRKYNFLMLYDDAPQSYPMGDDGA